MRMQAKLVVVGIVAALLTGCGQGQNSHDHVHLITDASGIQYADLVEGTGEPCEYHDVVLVHYTSWLANGKQINTSHDGGGHVRSPDRGPAAERCDAANNETRFR